MENNRRRRLATDVIGQLEDRLKDDDRDIQTWLELIQLIVQKDKVDDVREIYEKFLKKFPFLSQQWVSYIEYELVRGEFDNVNNIFKRCLVSVTGVELWKCYVNYVRRKNNLITGGEEARRVIFQAYDMAASKVGMDPDSGSLWVEYFNFIEDWKPNSTWDEQQKMDLKRKIYKRALVLPLNNLETLWSEYTSFENDLNPTTARKFIGEVSGAYMNARSLYKEWANLTQGLDRSLNSIPKTTDYNSSQLSKWRNWIKWEKANKLELSLEESCFRVDYVYRQAIQKLLFYPELWFEFVEYYRSNDQFFSQAKVQELLNESLLSNPTSFALNFKSIELYEMENNVALVEKKYDSFINNLTEEHEKLETELSNLQQSVIDVEIAKRRDDLQSRNNVNQDNANDEDNNEEEDANLKIISEEEKAFHYKKDPSIQHKQVELNKLSKTITLTYCQYMKTMKRLGGIQSARTIFKRCRAKKNIMTSQMFVENALLEHEINPTVALKVFDLGMKTFGNDGEYIYNYLKFLIKINDDTTTRTVFETNTTKKKDIIEPKWLKKMFKLFVNYEMKSGQLSNVDKLEKKYFEIFPDDSRLMLFADRYSFNTDPDDFGLDNDLIRSNDLKNSRDISNGRGQMKRRLDGGDDRESKKSHVEQEEGDGYELDINQSQGVIGHGQDGDDDDDDYDGINAASPGTNGHDTKPSVQDDGSEFVTDEIYNLLRVLPNATYFDTPLFNNSKLIRLLSDLS